MMPTETDNPALTDYRLTMIEKTLDAMAKNIDKLTVLEQRHIETKELSVAAHKRLDAHSDQISDHEARIRGVEGEMPTLKLTRGWVIAAVVGVFSLVGIAAVSLVVISRAPAQVQAAQYPQQVQPR